MTHANVNTMNRRRALTLAALLVMLIPACRNKSIEYVGKAGKSLGAYNNTLASLADECERQKGRDKCEQELVQMGGAAAANVYASDELTDKSLSMLATYGIALGKLSGKTSVGASDFAGGMLTLNGSTQWVDLGDSAPGLIKEGAKLIDKLIAGGVQRKVLVANYKQLGAAMGSIEERYKDVIEGKLQYMCALDMALIGHIETVEEFNCDESPDHACASKRALVLMQAHAARAGIQTRRKAIYDAAAGISVFFAAHEVLGDLLTSSKSDKEVLGAMKKAGAAGKTETKASLEAFETALGCGNPAKKQPVATTTGAP